MSLSLRNIPLFAGKGCHNKNAHIHLLIVAIFVHTAKPAPCDARDFIDAIYLAPFYVSRRGECYLVHRSLACNVGPPCTPSIMVRIASRPSPRRSTARRPSLLSVGCKRRFAFHIWRLVCRAEERRCGARLFRVFRHAQSEAEEFDRFRRSLRQEAHQRAAFRRRTRKCELCCAAFSRANAFCDQFAPLIGQRLKVGIALDETVVAEDISDILSLFEIKIPAVRLFLFFSVCLRVQTAPSAALSGSNHRERSGDGGASHRQLDASSAFAFPHTSRLQHVSQRKPACTLHKKVCARFGGARVSLVSAVNRRCLGSKIATFRSSTR